MKKTQYIIIGGVCVVFAITATLFFVKKDVKNRTQVEELITEQEKEDADGVAGYIFDKENILYTTAVVKKQWHEQDGYWLEVSIADMMQWKMFTAEKKEEIIKGLINTSRLQIDRDFGGVLMIYEGQIFMTGWWQRDQGYVIIEENQ